MPSKSIFHLHCGDCSADMARKSSIGGEAIVWTELLHEGLLTNEPFDAPAYLAARSKILSASTGGAIGPDACLRRLQKQDAELERAMESAEELVLWFDACLFDQTILARHLKWISGQEQRPEKLSLICIGEFPGKPKFLGLGELNPEELASLLPLKKPITNSMLADGRRIWDALASGSQEELLELAKGRVEGLPYMAEAIFSYLRQMPSLRNGLSELEECALESLKDGQLKPVELFKGAAARMKRPYFGDTTLWRTVNRLSSQEKPLLRVHGPGPLPCWDTHLRKLSDWQVELTETGRKVLAGELDNVALNGICLELGSFKLEGRSCLRFDEMQAAIKWK